MRIFITGGCGFIGSHFVREIHEQFPNAEIINIDRLTYAANPDNIADIAQSRRYTFIEGDIADASIVRPAIEGCTHVVNLAAESHVDRSIHGATDFIHTDVLGTYVLLEAARDAGVERFLQVSTDEVYGSIERGSFVETDPLVPSSPYSASKAGGDLQALAFMHTHGLPVLITRGSNTYGPNQYPEKMIPLFLTNAIEGQPLPVYGDGRQVRDWIHVRDHAQGIAHVLQHGEAGEVYNIGGGNERENIWITERILAHLDASDDLITHVEDRAGHDRRYSLDCSKAAKIGWTPQVEFDAGLQETAQWYQDNQSWWQPIKSGEFRDFYRKQYDQRLHDENVRSST